MKKSLLIVAALAVSCGSSELGQYSPGKKLDEALSHIDRSLMDGRNEISFKSTQAAQHIYRSGKDFTGDVGEAGARFNEERIRDSENLNDYIVEKKNNTSQWGSEKIEAAKVKARAAERKHTDNGRAVERKFHENKDHLNKRFAGSDREEQAREDEMQTTRIAALESALAASVAAQNIVNDSLVAANNEQDANSAAEFEELAAEVSALSLELDALTDVVNELDGDLTALATLTSTLNETLRKVRRKARRNRRKIRRLRNDLNALINTVDAIETCEGSSAPAFGPFVRVTITCGTVSMSDIQFSI